MEQIYELENLVDGLSEMFVNTADQCAIKDIEKPPDGTKETDLDRTLCCEVQGQKLQPLERFEAKPVYTSPMVRYQAKVEKKLAKCLKQLKIRDAFASEMLAVLADCNNLTIETDSGPDALFNLLSTQLVQFVANFRYLKSVDTLQQFQMAAAESRPSAQEAIIESMLQHVVNAFNGPSNSRTTLIDSLDQLRKQLEIFMSEYKELKASTAHFTLEYKTSLWEFSQQRQVLQVQCSARLQMDEHIKELQEQLEHKASECNWYKMEQMLNMEHINNLESKQNPRQAQLGQQHLGALLAVLKEKLIGHVSGMLRLNVQLNVPQDKDVEGLTVHREELALLTDDLKNLLMKQIAYINRLIVECNLSVNQEHTVGENYLQKLVNELHKQLNAVENKNMQLKLEMQSSSMQLDNFSDLRSELRITRDELYDMKNEQLQLSHDLLVYKRADRSEELAEQLQNYKQYAADVEQQLNNAFNLITDRDQELADLAQMFNELKESLIYMKQHLYQAPKVEQNCSMLEKLPRCKLDFAQLHQQLAISQDLYCRRQSQLEKDQNATAKAIDPLTDQTQMYQAHVWHLQLQLSLAQDHLRQQAQLAEQLWVVGENLGKHIQPDQKMSQQLQILQRQLNEKETELKDAHKGQDQCVSYISKLISYREQIVQLQRRFQQYKNLEQPFDQKKEMDLDQKGQNEQKLERQRMVKYLIKYQEKTEDLQQRLNQIKCPEKQLMDQLEAVMQELRDTKCANSQLKDKLLRYQKQSASQQEKQQLEQVMMASHELSRLRGHSQISAKYYQKLKQHVQVEIQKQNRNAVKNEARLRRQLEERSKQLKLAEQRVELLKGEQLPMVNQTARSDQSKLDVELRAANKKILAYKNQRKQLSRKLISYEERIHQLQQRLSHTKLKHDAYLQKDKQEMARQLESARRHIYDQNCAHVELHNKFVTYKERMANIEAQLENDNPLKAQLRVEPSTPENGIEFLTEQQDELKQNLVTLKENIARSKDQETDFEHLHQLTLQHLDELNKQFDSTKLELAQAKQKQAETHLELENALTQFELPQEQLDETDYRLRQPEWEMQRSSEAQLELTKMQHQLKAEREHNSDLELNQMELLAEEREKEEEILRMHKKLGLKVDSRNCPITTNEQRNYELPESSNCNPELTKANLELGRHKKLLAAMQYEMQYLQKDVKTYKEVARRAEQELADFQEQYSRSALECGAAFNRVQDIEKAFQTSESQVLQIQSEITVSQSKVDLLRSQLEHQGMWSDAVQSNSNLLLEHQSQMVVEDVVEDSREKADKPLQNDNDSREFKEMSLEEMNNTRFVIGHLHHRIGRLKSEGKAIALREYDSRRKTQVLEIELAKCNTDLNNMRYTSEQLLQERENYFESMANMHRKRQEDRARVHQLEMKCQQLQEQCSQSQSLYGTYANHLSEDNGLTQDRIID